MIRMSAWLLTLSPGCLSVLGVGVFVSFSADVSHPVACCKLMDGPMLLHTPSAPKEACLSVAVCRMYVCIMGLGFRVV